MSNASLRRGLLFLILASPPISATAQFFWLPQPEGPSLSVEWRKPAFDEGDNLTLSTSLLFLSTQLPLTARLRLVAEIPIAHIGFRSDLVKSSNTALGNPLLGLSFSNAGTPWEVLVGLRPPIASDKNEAVFVGLFAAPDRVEAFQTETFSLLGLGSFRYRHASGFAAQLRAGPSLTISTTRRVGAHPEAYLRYGVQMWYEVPYGQVGVGLTGRAWLTEPDLTWRERTANHLTLAVLGTLASWHPGILLHLPLDDARRAVVRVVVGLSLTRSL